MWLFFWALVFPITMVIVSGLYFERNRYMRELEERCGETEAMLRRALEREKNALNDKHRLAADVDDKTELLRALAKDALQMARNTGYGN